MAAPGQLSLYRVVADPQQGGHALARGHQVGVGDAQPRLAHRVQCCCHQRLHRDVPIAVAGRKAPGQILSLSGRPLAQLCLGGIGGLLGQCAAQGIGGHPGGDVAHARPADLGIHPGAQRYRQQNGLPAAFQVLVHVLAGQKSGIGQGGGICQQPHRPGRRCRQQRHRALLQQCQRGSVRLAVRAEIPRRLRQIYCLRLFKRQRAGHTDCHEPHLLTSLK